MLKIDLTPKRPPDLVIGPEDNPYMRRWWIRKAGTADLYLHQICRSDDARALHDHRSDNLSIILSGSYIEIIAPLVKGRHNQWYDVANPKTIHRGPGSVIWRKAEQPHRLVVADGKPVWTLWFKPKDRREWGFWPKVREIVGDGFESERYEWMQWQEYSRVYGDRA